MCICADMGPAKLTRTWIFDLIYLLPEILRPEYDERIYDARFSAWLSIFCCALTHTTAPPPDRPPSAVPSAHRTSLTAAESSIEYRTYY